MNIAAELGLEPLPDDLRRVEQRLTESVEQRDRLLSDSAAHLLRAGGKRLRPSLAMCVAYAAKGPVLVAESVVDGASAVELVHLGSLYHDDVIDEAETRRGVPSVNAHWSNIVAILAGDYLLAAASEIAAALGADIAALLARTIGELCRGQVLELEHLFDVDRSEETYRSSIEGKTASLMAASCRISAMVNRLDETSIDGFTEFGHHLGMCFQIVDDVLDITRTEAELGKPAGNDLVEGVYTLPVIRALEESGELRGLLGGPIEGERLASAVGIVREPKFVDAALTVARDHADQAGQALADLDGLDHDVTDRLRVLVQGLVTRST